MSNLLSAYQPAIADNGQGPPRIDPMFSEAKVDIIRMLEILDYVGSAAPEMQKTRTEVLRTAVEGIQW